MGNRAVITTKENFENNGIGIYVHWNGGYDSVSAFLKYCELRGFRSPSEDNYGWARLCQVIANFLGKDGLSVGIDTINHLDCDNWDNGVYIIDKWNIVDRKFFNGSEQKVYEMEEMLISIDNAQPTGHKLGKKYIKAKEVPTSTLKIGDTIYVRDWMENIQTVTIIGKGEKGNIVNGCDVTDVPYISVYSYGIDDDPSLNINNYLREKSYKIVV